MNFGFATQEALTKCEKAFGRVASPTEDLAKMFVDSAMRLQQSNRDKARAAEALVLAINQLDGSISVPNKLETFGDDLLIKKVIDLAIGLEMRIVKSPGKYDSMKDLKPEWANFITGYCDELISEQKIAHITYAKAGSYGNGRAAARLELLRHCVSADQQGYITNVHERIIGVSKSEPGMLSIMINAVFKEEFRGDAREFFKNLAAYASKQQKLGKDKIEVKHFFMSFDQLISRRKRTTEVSIKKGKKTLKVKQSLTPTKPSQLRTVAPVERSAITELYESAWLEMKKLAEVYTTANPWSIKRQDVERQIVEITNKMWKSKQFVLKCTQHRRVTRDRNGVRYNLKESLAETAAILSECKSPDDLFKILREKNLQWLPVGKYQWEDRVFTSFTAFMAETKDSIFPQVYELNRSLQKSTNPHSSDGSSDEKGN